MGPHAYYRLRTPDGTGVSARVAARAFDTDSSVYLAVGSPLRMALTRDEAYAVLGVLVAALGTSQSPPEWALADIEATDAKGKPLNGVAK